MTTLTNKHILLAVTGSIAAYKSPDIVRRLQELGAEVRIILTKGGAKFITELCLQAISKNQIYTSLWDKEAELSMGHIALARWADCILIAPSSANTIAKLASGRADDLITSVVLASSSPVVIAPAMNQQMYASSAIKENLATLKKRQITVISPDFGKQACGDVGDGRLAEVKAITENISQLFLNTKLTGKNVLITVGATIEAIDPVRYLSNHSSGKMGMALAKSCVEAGAKVTLIYGNISVPIADRTTSFQVISANEMHRLVMDKINNQDIFISCAAVSDYRVKNIAQNKLKKKGKPIQIELVENKDILSDVSQLKNRPICIGFAAETENLIQNAKKKLVSKGCDAMILNDVSKANFGLQSNDNEVVFLTQNISHKIQRNHKQKIAKKIVEILVQEFF